jgi:hypothetical protein
VSGASALSLLQSQFGFGANMMPLNVSVRLGSHHSKDQWTVSVPSSLTSGGDVLIAGGKDVKLLGGTQITAQGDIGLIAGNDIELSALKPDID